MRYDATRRDAMRPEGIPIAPAIADDHIPANSSDASAFLSFALKLNRP